MPSRSPARCEHEQQQFSARRNSHCEWMWACTQAAGGWGSPRRPGSWYHSQGDAEQDDHAATSVEACNQDPGQIALGCTSRCTKILGDDGVPLLPAPPIRRWWRSARHATMISSGRPRSAFGVPERAQGSRPSNFGRGVRLRIPSHAVGPRPAGSSMPGDESADVEVVDGHPATTAVEDHRQRRGKSRPQAPGGSHQASEKPPDISRAPEPEDDPAPGEDGDSAGPREGGKSAHTNTAMTASPPWHPAAQALRGGHRRREAPPSAST